MALDQSTLGTVCTVQRDSGTVQIDKYAFPLSSTLNRARQTGHIWAPGSHEILAFLQKGHFIDGSVISQLSGILPGPVSA